MTKQFNAENIHHRSLVNENNWIEYARESESTEFLGYIEANEHLTNELETRIEKSKNFFELKQEMLELLKDRQNFIVFANKNLP